MIFGPDGHIVGPFPQIDVAAQRLDRFGPYEVIGLLGTGGMGEVYRARDPRLKRDVAIKVLAHAGTDPVRQRRFTDEAQAASALSHPNIVTVYDVGSRDGMPFIVSEIIDGVSLRQILARAPVPTRELLDLAAQMADGLAAAHQAGIVHRDFKPENVMVTRDGRVKILDFGLALVGTRDGTSGSEVDLTLTAAGMVVGTVPYMSPEQARGAAVDYRTDQFSLGLTLYEMATGRRAFTADTAAQILAAILEDEPEPVAKLNARVPAPVCWVIERCLAKDPRHRYDATTDLARELRTLQDRVAEFTSPIEIAVPVRYRRRRAMLGIGAVGAAAAVGVLGLLARATGTAEPSLDRYTYTPFATDAGYQASPAWSPDGKTLAYVAEVDGVLQVFQKSLSSPMRTQVTRARFDCRDPFWSPDGTRLYYISLARDREGLWSISAAGGDPDLAMENVSSASLSPDGKTLAFFRDAGPQQHLLSVKLWLSSPPGSTPVLYTRPPFGEGALFSQATVHFSPDGLNLGAWVSGPNGAGRLSEFWRLPLGNGASHLVPAPVADLPQVVAAFSWLPDSRHVVSALPRPRPGVHLWLTDTGPATSRLLTSSGGWENSPAVSPDGSTIAMALQQGDYDLYQLSLDHPSPSVVLATSRNEMDPASSISGDVMAFTTDRAGQEEIWLRSQKGDFERPLVTAADFGASPTYLLSAPAISPDGGRIAYNRVGPEGDRVWITPVSGGPPIQLAPGEYPQDGPSWSPDGVWVAYEQGGAGVGSPQVAVLARRRVGSRAAAEVVTPDILPMKGIIQWAPDGAWIAYNGQSGLSVVSPDGKSKRVLSEQNWMAFTWSADAHRLYGIRLSDDFKHLTLTSVDIKSGTEHVLSPNFLPLPVSEEPIRGFTRISPTTFLTSVVKVRSDVWLLRGLQPSSTAWDRWLSTISFRRP